MTRTLFTFPFPLSGFLRNRRVSVLSLICFVFALVFSQAQADEQKITTTTVKPKPSLETDVLQPTVGHQEGKTGARIESVEQMEDGKTVKIHVSLPDGANSDIEEVIVMGRPDKKPKKESTLLQKQKFEVVNNLDEGRSGIVIYLGKQEDFMLRLNYTEPRPDVEPDVFNRD
ncbi:hypothetical protein KOI40_14905 [Aestuariicella sp. G3-2]|uniref:hypothetical protein n=1 Tax=Pseudomaricurvus albidus TaxID=2842452 RepID=UPI001C0DB016|nr:hypothetical protein [Aestuariicella albida]MBU3071112.1 hypothetical protein [Aestuariicella albida]